MINFFVLIQLKLYVLKTRCKDMFFFYFSKQFQGTINSN